LIRKELFETLGYYDTKYKVVSDKDFFIKCYLAQKEIIYFNELICNMSNLGISNTNIKLVLVENFMLRVSYGMNKTLSYIIYLYQYLKHFIKRLIKQI
jgi:hypothetical protein